MLLKIGLLIPSISQLNDQAGGYYAYQNSGRYGSTFWFQQSYECFELRMTVASFHHHLGNVLRHGLFLYLKYQVQYYAHDLCYNLFCQHHRLKSKVDLDLSHRDDPPLY